jgi:hypothetical protein
MREETQDPEIQSMLEVDSVDMQRNYTFVCEHKGQRYCDDTAMSENGTHRTVTRKSCFEDIK